MTKVERLVVANIVMLLSVITVVFSVELSGFTIFVFSNIVFAIIWVFSGRFPFWHIPSNLTPDKEDRYFRMRTEEGWKFWFYQLWVDVNHPFRRWVSRTLGLR